MQKRHPMKRPWVLPLLVVALLGAAAGPSAAQVSRYDRVKITPIKKGGAVVGAKIKLVLFKQRSEQTRILLGVMPSRAISFTKDAAMNPESGLWLHRFADVTEVKVNEPRELELEVRYGKGSKLTGGEKYQLVTTWPTESWKPGEWVHVFGPNWKNGADGGWGEPEISLPK